MGGFRALVGAVLVSLCAVSAQADDRPKLVTVNAALQDLTQRLLGDAAEVIFPVPEGVDPSFWRPSIAAISMIQSADLIVLNGAGFATWVDRVSLPRSRLVNSTAAIEELFIVTESITHSHGDGGEHSHEGLASYTWLDPTLAIAQAEAIAAAITARALAPEDEVAERLAALKQELKAADAQAQNALKAARGVTLIATHPRYQYFARRYGLTIASLEWEAGETPTAEALAELEALVAETGAGVLVWEAAPGGGVFEVLAGLGVRSVVFEPLAQGPLETGFVAHFNAAVAALADAVAGRGD